MHTATPHISLCLCQISFKSKMVSLKMIHWLVDFTWDDPHAISTLLNDAAAEYEDLQEIILQMVMEEDSRKKGWRLSDTEVKTDAGR